MLSAEDRQQIDTAQTDRRAVLNDVLTVVNEKQKVCLKKQWKFKRKNGETVALRDVLSKIVIWVNKFKEVGDTLVQYDPGHAALPWAAVRFVLQAAVNENEIHAAMLEGVEQVFSLIARYTTVETLYLQNVSMERERLKGAIVKFYAAILQFLLTARRHFSHSTGHRILGSVIQTSEMKIDSHLQNIVDAEKEVNAMARLIDAEYIQKIGELLEGGLTGVNTKLDTMNHEFRLLQSGGFSGVNTRLDTMNHEFQLLQSDLKTQFSVSEADRRSVLAWLSAVSTADDYDSAVSARVQNTCEWILDRPA